MTWEEFKKYIDGQMKEKGIPESAEIKYVDFSYPCLDHESCRPEVYFSDGTVAIH